MEFQLISEDQELKSAVGQLLQDTGHSYGGKGVSISLEQSENPVLKVIKNKDKAQIVYKDRIHFFRGIGHLLAHCEEDSYEKTETVYMDNLGLMIDCSRNGVPNLQMLKCTIREMALLGMNQLFLYMEDVYEIPEYPYFGALRGRYTKEELKECDNYACMYGVELIPCIQTLAHLGTFLRWEEHRDLRDTPENLIPGEDQVYVLIDTMLKNISECFSSKKIHLGMDEAHSLGLGQYLKKYGYTDPLMIMKRHLDKVLEICKKYDVEPMIWSDMYFSTYAQDNSYYNLPSEFEWPEEEKPDKDLTLVYWDYYSHDAETYERMLHLHKKLSDKIYFAGGGWTWSGVAPNYPYAFDRTKTGMKVMKEQGIRNCFLTIWMDDGAETPFSTQLLPMILFAEEGYEKEVEDIAIDEQLRLFRCGSIKDWFLLSEFDYLTDFDPCARRPVDPSKELLYQDPLIGLFDAQYEGYDLAVHYKNLAGKLCKAEENVPGDLFTCYRFLAEFLSLKGDLGTEIRRAYLSEDPAGLNKIAEQRIPECLNMLDQYRDYREKIWFAECKPNGFEVLDIRLGGVDARLKSAQKRIRNYLNGEIQALPELEETRLPFSGKDSKENPMPVMCNQWDHIVSAGMIGGERL